MAVEEEDYYIVVQVQFMDPDEDPTNAWWNVNAYDSEGETTFTEDFDYKADAVKEARAYVRGVRESRPDIDVAIHEIETMPRGYSAVRAAWFRQHGERRDQPREDYYY